MASLPRHARHVARRIPYRIGMSTSTRSRRLMPAHERIDRSGSVHRVIVAILCTIGLGFTAVDERAIADRPTLGLSLRDSAVGPIVGWVFPGPLGGSGFDSTIGIRRGDLVVALAETPVDSVAAFEEALARLAIGAPTIIAVRRAPDAAPRSAVPDPGSVDAEGAETVEFTVTVGSRDRWTGTLGRAAGDHRPEAALPEGEYEQRLRHAATEHGLTDAPGGLAALEAHLTARMRRDLDPNAVAAVIDAFEHPLRVDAIVRSISTAARRSVEGTPSESLLATLELIATVLGVDGHAEGGGEPADSLPERPDTDPFAPIVDGLKPDLIADAQTLLRRMRDSVYLDPQHAEAHIAVIRESPPIVDAALRASLTEMPRWHAWVEAVGAAHADGPALARDELPEVVRAAVEGDVLHFELDHRERILLVVGGPGRNVYRMARIAAVYDVGGDDHYIFEMPAPHRQVIIDLAGDDFYEARDPFCGPGTGVFGFGLVDDRGGNDIYRSASTCSLGAGLFGVGVILDGGGDDRYENLGPESGWSMGVGFYGAGVIVSRAGHDAFHGERVVQGVGGPRGFGAVINGAGNDLYRAEGTNFPSVYGTPGVNATFGQGFGYGIRHYAMGGVGAIIDFGGHDRYEGGEFAQGCGYFWGMGFIHDAAGNDLYRGNRYGQAAAAHQAVGVLLDDGGDDTFWSMTAASQSGAWDESITMLVARGGNNTFRCDGLGQGAAAHQSIAVLVVDGGTAQFSAGGRSTQGESSTNEYHYGRTGVHSFSALLSLGAESRFSSRRERTGPVGETNDADEARSRLYGLFVRE